MVEKEIKWSAKALQDKLAILDYWINRNQFKVYSQKLDTLFDVVLNNTIKNPEAGKKTNYKNIRVRIVSHYLIFYLIKDEFIEVVRIWDSRRETKKLNL